MDTSPSSSLPSSPLPLSYLYSQFHNLFITLENLTARDSLSFLPLPRTCSATFHRAPCLLNSASPSQLWPLPPRGSISSSGEPKLTNPGKFFEGLQSAPSVLTCSVTEVPYHCGEPRAQWQDTTGYACWGKPWKKHHFKQPGNFTPKIHSGNFTGKANFQNQGYSF